MDLVQIVDSAMAEAVRRGGGWIACRPGCTSCCLGPFEITTTDAERLRTGLDHLDAAAAAEIVARALAYSDGDDDPCPVLDVASGLCLLYDWRPLLCRTFGPATRIGASVGVCTLCFEGAPDDEIARCAVELDPALFESPEHLTIAQALASRS